MRLAVFLVASLFVLHPVRFLLTFNNADLFKALYVLGILTAIYTLRPMRAYGRGERV